MENALNEELFMRHTRVDQVDIDAYDFGEKAPDLEKTDDKIPETNAISDESKETDLNQIKSSNNKKSKKENNAVSKVAETIDEISNSIKEDNNEAMEKRISEIESSHDELKASEPPPPDEKSNVIDEVKNKPFEQTTDSKEFGKD